MKIVMSNIGSASFLLSQQVPVAWEGHVIPGAERQVWVYEMASILQQQVSPDDERGMIYTLSKTEEQLKLHITAEEPLLICEVILKGSVLHTTGSKTFEVGAGHFTIIYAPQANLYTEVKTAHLNEIIHFFYRPQLVLPLLKYYPLLNKFCQAVNLNESALISEDPLVITAGMLDICGQLLQAPFAPAIKRFHAERMETLLSFALQAVSLHISVFTSFSTKDVENIYAAKKFIDSHLTQHHTISQLARKIGMNEQKLKAGFKTIFGLGPFAYLQRERLAIAKAQLEETRRSVKAIASSAGYKYVNNFCVAFKRTFGITPSEIRKQRQKKDEK
jgi:AraC-like DNA-binding protein